MFLYALESFVFVVEGGGGISRQVSSICTESFVPLGLREGLLSQTEELKWTALTIHIVYSTVQRGECLRLGWCDPAA